MDALTAFVALFLAVGGAGLFVDQMTTDKTKETLFRILFATRSGALATTPISILKMFRFVFQRGKRRVSFIRSALVSILLFLVSFVTVSMLLEWPKHEHALEQFGVKTLDFDDFRLVIALCIANIVGDYVSLWQTRVFMGILIRRPVWQTWIGLLLDIILTFLTWHVMVTVIFVATFVIQDFSKSFETPFETLLVAFVAIILIAYKSINSLELNVIMNGSVIIAGVITTFFTTLWIVMFLFVQVCLPRVLSVVDKGVPSLTSWVRIQEHPFTACFLIFLIILQALGWLAHSAIWLLS